MSGKPPGIGLTMLGGPNGMPHFYVVPIDRVADQIWDAVREAINANMTPEKFKEEAAEAWCYHLAEDAKQAVREITGRK